MYSKKNGVFNVGSGVSRSFKDIVDILQFELLTNLEIEYFQNPYDDYQIHTQADISSSIANFNFKPLFSLEEGIKSYIPIIKKCHKMSIL